MSFNAFHEMSLVTINVKTIQPTSIKIKVMALKGLNWLNSVKTYHQSLIAVFKYVKFPYFIIFISLNSANYFQTTRVWIQELLLPALPTTVLRNTRKSVVPEVMWQRGLNIHNFPLWHLSAFFLLYLEQKTNTWDRTIKQNKICHPL